MLVSHFLRGMLASKAERAVDVFGMKSQLEGARFIGTNNTCYYFERDGVLMKWNESIGLESKVTRRARYADVPPEKSHVLVFKDEMDKLGLDSLQSTQYGTFDVFETPKGLVFKDLRVCYMIPL